MLERGVVASLPTRQEIGDIAGLGVHPIPLPKCS
jgi:hypothetical protein